jgi:hypothetical protein
MIGWLPQENLTTGVQEDAAVSGGLRDDPRHDFSSSSLKVSYNLLDPSIRIGIDRPEHLLQPCSSPSLSYGQPRIYGFPRTLSR